MKTELTTFDFKGISLRCVMIDDQPWFVAADALAAMGYTTHNASSHYAKVSAADKCYIARTSVGMAAGRPVTGLSEAGLYTLTMRSDKPSALAFQDWVVRDVLPAIRKDGAYVMDEEKVVTGELSEDDFILKAMKMMEAKVERLARERDEAAAERGIVASQLTTNRITLHKFIRTLEGVNSVRTKRDLLEAGYLYRRNQQYRVYSKHMDKFAEKIDPTYSTSEITVLPKGAELLAAMHREGRLTMKVGHAVPN